MATPYGNDDDLKKGIDDNDDVIQSSKPTPQGHGNMKINNNSYKNHKAQPHQLSSYNELYSNSNYVSNEVLSSNKIIGYGILGCAGIASKIARAIHLAPNSQITCVASRSLEKAQNFVSRNCPHAEAMTYDELILSDKCQVIYIPIPTALRLPWIVKAIEQVHDIYIYLIYIHNVAIMRLIIHNKQYTQKKHILCEKPVGSPKYVEVIIPSCRAKNVQFMDGVEFMHHPRFKELTEKVHKSRIIGKVRRVVSSFSVPCTDDNNIRNQPDLEPLGVLGDLGIHNIRLSLWAFDYDPPRFVKALCHKYSKKTGAIQDCSVWLFFTGDRVASFDCSYHNPLRQHAEIVGDRASINIRQFAIPNQKKCSYTIHYSTLNTYDTAEHIEHKIFQNAIQEVDMIKRMTRISITNKTEQFWPSVSLMTEQILDACRRSINKDGILVEFVRGQLWWLGNNSNGK